MYRNVYDLTKEELNELKNKMLYGCDECENLDDDEQEVVNEAVCEEDIPDEIVFIAFCGCSFVPEDFFCNC